MIASAELTTLRMATPQDTEYIYRLTEGTMRGYVETTWGEWNESLSRSRIAEAVASGNFSLIYFEKALVGAMHVERHPTHIQLEQIYIGPSHQRQGIGARLVEELMSEAKRSAKSVRLRVLKANPVREFYERLGFAVTEVTSERYFMEYHA
jgi:ribosomal protein S18 acetylase RimI-like enzyme